MKKSLTVLAAAAMAGTLILGGCAKPEAVEAEKPETAEDTVLGGWTCTDIGKVAGISAEGEAAISKALEGFTGVNLKPVVLLGTQLVSGTNYMFLCRGNTVTENPVTSLYVTVVYEDLEGNCTITDNKVFDLNTYVTPAE